MSSKTSNPFSRAVRTRRPDSSGGDRPSSGRSSFVDRLRSMQLDPLRRGSSRAGTPAAGSVGARTSNAESNRSAADASRMAASTAATAARRSAAMEQLNQSAAGRSSGPAQRGQSPSKSVGRGISGLRVSGGEPTGGLRSGGTKAVRSGDGAKDTSLPRTGSAAAGRQSSKLPQDRGLKVAITLMTRKPHRFDWCAPPRCHMPTAVLPTAAPHSCAHTCTCTCTLILHHAAACDTGPA